MMSNGSTPPADGEEPVDLDVNAMALKTVMEVGATLFALEVVTFISRSKPGTIRECEVSVDLVVGLAL